MYVHTADDTTEMILFLIFRISLLPMVELFGFLLYSFERKKMIRAIGYSSILSLIRICTTANVCYNDIDCLSLDFPWFSPMRPLPAPSPPEKINVQLYLCTRKDPSQRYKIDLRPTITAFRNIDFERNRRHNVFIIHGFTHNANFTWIDDMKNAYLAKRDANVFLVDWGNSAITLNYLQAASDVRVVGAELARFVNHLITNYDVSPTTIHVIGHSLGAHTAAYCGKILSGRIGRITGLDPAQPAFEDCDPEVRLTKTDAVFVDVLHTDSRPFVLGGFGFILPCGHVDIYANGGTVQPGCVINTDNVKFNFGSIADFGRSTFYSVASILSCSHTRSFEYFTEALTNDGCVFWAKQAPLSKKYLQLTTGTVTSIGPITSSYDNCSIHTCTVFGLETPHYPGRGVFVMKTKADNPFCQLESETTSYMHTAKEYFDNYITQRITGLRFFGKMFGFKRITNSQTETKSIFNNVL